MPNGILWSSIDGIALTTRPLGGSVMQAINPTVSSPMYVLWAIIGFIFIMLVRATQISLKREHRKRAVLLLIGLVMLTVGFVFDMLIDFGINKFIFYISEYVILIFVVLMSLHLSDQLRKSALYLESLVAERTEALTIVNKELESFSYSVSHDLRAPLRAIYGFANALKEDSPRSLDSTARSHIQRILHNVERMQDMINGMLKLSKITRDEVEKEKIDISEMANEIINDLQDRDRKHKVSISVDNGIFVLGDPALIHILLENLLSNALKYTAKVAEPKLIVKKFVSDQGENGFVVTDNGIGFDSTYADKLFSPFQRLHSANEFPGIGIGLATASRIVNRHRGKIWAESQKGQGASFYVLIGGN